MEIDNQAEAASHVRKLRVDRRPFLAPKGVISDVQFTGPYILVVEVYESYGIWMIQSNLVETSLVSHSHMTSSGR